MRLNLNLTKFETLRLSIAEPKTKTKQIHFNLSNLSFSNGQPKSVTIITLTMKRVVILKSESDSTDNYSTLLRENNFDPVFIPTLEFRFKNLDILREKLCTPDGFSGIIFTSPRCVEACEQSLIPTGSKIDEKWSKLHNYCVGEVTHNVIIDALSLSARGKHTGNANNLADFIFENLEGARLETPFLFPCGNLRQDTLQLKLLDYGYFVDATEVYETVAHSELEASLRKALIEDKAEYLCFFSPSGVNYTNAILKKLEINLQNYKLIAIGPSTRKCLESSDYKVYKTAEKPSVEYLVKALIESQ